MLEARFGGKWWLVAQAYVDGVEVVIGTDPVDGQVLLRWLPSRRVADYRLASPTLVAVVFGSR